MRLGMTPRWPTVSPRPIGGITGRHKPPADQAPALPRWQLWASVASRASQLFRLADSAQPRRARPPPRAARLELPGQPAPACPAQAVRKMVGEVPVAAPVPVRVLADHCSHKEKN